MVSDSEDSSSQFPQYAQQIVEPPVDSADLNDLFNILEIHWIDNMSIRILIRLFKSLMMFCINGDMKSENRTLLQSCLELKDLSKKMSENKIPENATITFQSLVDLLKSEGCFTTLSTFHPQKIVLNEFAKLLQQGALATSSHSSGTKTICMPSTTAPTAIPGVSALELPPLEQSADVLGQLLGVTESTTVGGTISSHISPKKCDSQFTLKLEEDCGFAVIKLEVFPYQEIAGLPKEQWWKKAKTRSVFTIPSAVDPIKMHLDKALQLAAKNMLQKGAKKESRKMNFYNGSSSSRQAPY